MSSYSAKNMGLLKFCVLFVFLSKCESSKILFISPSLSNSVVMQAGRLADLLVQNGHNVTFVIPELSSKNQHNGTKLAKVIRIGGIRDYWGEALEYYLSDTWINKLTPFYKMIVMAESQMMFCRDFLRKRNEWNHLKDEHFDVVLTNSLDFCDLGYAHYLEINAHIWLVTGALHEFNYQVLGVHHPVSYIPTMEDNLKGTKMGIVERAHNMYMWFQAHLLRNYYYHRAQSVFRAEINPNFPDLHELGSKVALTFVNDNEFLDFAGPTLNKIKFIGGAGLQQPQKLDENWEVLMQKGKKGAILVSFGTAFNPMFFPPETKKSLIRAFQHFSDYHFIFKAQKDDSVLVQLLENTTNVDIVEWVPQSDILAHPRLRGFISHGGMNSVVETALRGVPVIVLPLFFDQLRNAKMVEYREIGLFLEPENLSEKNLIEKIDRLLFDPKYQKGAKRLAKLIATSPNQPDKVFLDWTNFVIENGPLPELIPNSVNLNFFQYYCIDILCISCLIILAIFYLIFKLSTLIKNRNSKEKLE
uniref:UDP-glucuronosyltransferase n=1 Tax=Panagrolaimus sp. JU765 TaxID=591449 RepID=A0AC34Q935_9BILA